MKMFYEDDIDENLIRTKKIAVLGYGSQGHAHSLNLKDSGFDVVVGLYEGSKSKDKAESNGLTVLSNSEAVKRADVIMFCLPDTIQGAVYNRPPPDAVRIATSLLRRIPTRKLRGRSEATS